MNRVKLFILTAIFLATAFALSCSSGDDEGGGDGNSPSVCTDNSYDASSPITYEGQTYNTVKIGCQTWMAKNLNYAVSGSKCIEAYDEVSDGLIYHYYRYIDENTVLCDKYGRWYDWETAMTVCPSGWHLPSGDEWKILLNYVQTDNGGTNGIGYFSIAGKYLKAMSGWAVDDNGQSGNGEDKYGFAALPGGTTSVLGLVGKDSFWYTSSKNRPDRPNDDAVVYITMSSFSDEVRSWAGGTHAFFSVRCVKN